MWKFTFVVKCSYYWPKKITSRKILVKLIRIIEGLLIHSLIENKKEFELNIYILLTTRPYWENIGPRADILPVRSRASLVNTGFITRLETAFKENLYTENWYPEDFVKTTCGKNFKEKNLSQLSTQEFCSVFYEKYRSYFPPSWFKRHKSCAESRGIIRDNARSDTGKISALAGPKIK